MAKKYVEKFKFNETGSIVYIQDAEAQEKLTQHDAMIDTMKKNVHLNAEGIADIKEWNAAIIHPYDFYSGGNMVLVGDSYCVNANESLEPGWSDGEGFGKLVSGYLGMTLKNYSQSGIGFSDYNTSVNFETRIRAAISGMSDEEKDNTKMVLFAGGANDGSGDDSTIYNRIKTCLQLAHTNFKNARVAIAFIGYSRNGAQLEYMNAGREKWYGSAAIIGMPVLRGCEWSLHHWNRVGEDNLHPTSEGQAMIAKYVTSALVNGFVSCYREKIEKGDLIARTDGVTDFNNGYHGFKCSMNDGVCHISFPTITYGYGTGGYRNMTMDGTTQAIVADVHSFLNGGYIRSQFNGSNVPTNTASWTAQAKVYVNDHSFNEIEAIAELAIVDGRLQVAFSKTDGGEAITYSVSGFTIYPNSVSVPCDMG